MARPALQPGVLDRGLQISEPTTKVADDWEVVRLRRLVPELRTRDSIVVYGTLALASLVQMLLAVLR